MEYETVTEIDLEIDITEGVNIATVKKKKIDK